MPIFDMTLEDILEVDKELERGYLHGSNDNLRNRNILSADLCS